MKFHCFLIILVNIYVSDERMCGCRYLNKCYETMLNELMDLDEVPCVEDAAIGESSMMVYLTALKQYCGKTFQLTSTDVTFEGRHLQEVVITLNEGNGESKPVILIEAGQLGGTESTGLALYIIEQLLACQENKNMIKNVRWVILPCTNPDGQEYSRYTYKMGWKKNLKVHENGLSVGVDISRNFDYQWNSCPKVDNGFSPDFPGTEAASENETIFIKNTLEKYKSDIKAYVSIRKDGHALLYPYAFTKNSPSDSQNLMKIAADITERVNRRAGGVHIFVNESIYEQDNKAHCGHSVDYAYSIGIPLAYEMRVFLGSSNRILSKFRALPRGYEATLRTGYYNGIRELYNAIVRDKLNGNKQTTQPTDVL